MVVAGSVLVTRLRVQLTHAGCPLLAAGRKEECERQLAQLEKDIERLSGSGPVLVVDE